MGGGGYDGVMITDTWEQTSSNWNVIKEMLLKPRTKFSGLMTLSVMSDSHLTHYTAYMAFCWFRLTVS